MFTTGQWTFALIFLIAFILLMIWSYKGDKKLHRKQYKESIWILVGFIIFIVALFVIKTVMKQ